jgi:trehalose 6-phosphate phosphatase
MRLNTLPAALPQAQEIRARRTLAGRLLVGLDFDGTLAPIVPHPSDAAMPDSTKDALEQLVSRRDTIVAFVSGRSAADLRARVALENVFYAGNHGLEIIGPDVTFIHQDAAARRDHLDALIAALTEPLVSFEGVTIEDKGLTLSVHFRTVTDERDAAQVRTIVHQAGRAFGALRLTDGKKVVEVRPDVDWHKGRAFELLRSRIAAAPALFIGDDRTDEDVFRTLGAHDYAIFVGPTHAVTLAHLHLESTEEVGRFLWELAKS